MFVRCTMQHKMVSNAFILCLIKKWNEGETGKSVCHWKSFEHSSMNSFFFSFSQTHVFTRKRKVAEKHHGKLRQTTSCSICSPRWKTNAWACECVWFYTKSWHRQGVVQELLIEAIRLWSREIMGECVWTVHLIPMSASFNNVISVNTYGAARESSTLAARDQIGKIKRAMSVELADSFIRVKWYL